MSEEINTSITWYAIPDAVFEKVIIATVGVNGKSEIVCIAYHYDFRDANRDGKTSLGEKICGLAFDDEYSMNMQIGKWLELNVLENNGSFHEFYTDNLNKFLSKTAHVATSAVNYLYFNVIIGTQISTILTNAGVTGIKKFFYKKAIESALKGVLKL
jgi:hypothetical protein